MWKNNDELCAMLLRYSASLCGGALMRLFICCESRHQSSEQLYLIQLYSTIITSVKPQITEDLKGFQTEPFLDGAQPGH